MNRLLPTNAALQLLRYLSQQLGQLEYDAEKHRLLLPHEAGDATLYFRLPLTIASPVQGKFAMQQPVNYIILLIQSGNCALGYFENGRNLNHKVFRSYMVRKKQGKSQVKYLKTKGKSRAGSRVRLGETLEFFENINGRLQEYFEHHTIDRIAISCSKTLLPYLYSSKTETPFTKSDPRLLKIPRHVHTPIYEVLLDTNRYLLRGELVFDEQGRERATQLLEAAGITGLQHTPEEDSDSWEEDQEDESADEDVFYDEEDEEEDEMEW
ncbi:hypothetical protein H7F15_16715 [Pontibacter sp. Tf4]|uniref:hypothetical protein n=1 Tax=Pontibacter sp. Tf4 TaxID=2761620 RepID=UPI001629E6E6|nr:hypothetical protein [Pontibacter sp. Tf4]MBB6612687.1 hypothetical protein [Pontibacter sp. Tf4]